MAEARDAEGGIDEVMRSPASLAMAIQADRDLLGGHQPSAIEGVPDGDQQRRASPFNTDAGVSRVKAFVQCPRRSLPALACSPAAFR